jgi:hypothetical protein
MNTQSKRNLKHFTLPILALSFACNWLTGCGAIKNTVGSLIGGASAITAQTTTTIDNAIAALDQNSNNWQSVLQDLEQKLADDAQKTVKG